MREGLSVRGARATPWARRIPRVTSRDGVFLVLDGPDGGGKTTQALRLVERVRGLGRQVVHLREPGGTVLGERVRALLLDPEVGEIDATTEVLLFQAARRRLALERIRPAIEAGAVVVCERWWFSTQAYQGAGGGVDGAVLRVTTRIATEGLEPRRAILLDVGEDVAAARMSRTLDRVERRGPDYRRRVRAEFRRLFLADPDRFVWIDAGRSEDQVAEAVWHAFRDLVE